MSDIMYCDAEVRYKPLALCILTAILEDEIKIIQIPYGDSTEERGIKDGFKKVMTTL